MTDFAEGSLLAATTPTLRGLLQDHPHALVSAIDESGLFVPVPDSIVLTTQAVAVAQTALDLVQPADRMLVVDAWEAVKELGTATVQVLLAGAEPLTAQMDFIDVREEHGVFFAVIAVVDAPFAGRSATPPVLEVATPRLARTRKDQAAFVLWTDSSVTGMLGWEPEDMVGRKSLEFIHPDDRDRAIAVWMECLSQPGWTSRARLRHLHSDGRWIWLEISNHNVLDDPAHGYVDCEMLNISDEMEAHEAVRASEELLRRLAEALPVGVGEFDFDYRLLYANERLYEILGAEAGAGAEELLRSLADPSQFEQSLRAVRRGEDVDIELQLDRLDGGGRRRCTLAMRGLSSADGQVIGGVLALTDITDAARMRSELEQRATYDALTGCLNRPSVMDRLAAVVGQPADGPGVAVVFVDLNDFKAVNDQHGHAVGDTLLVAVSARVREAVRGADVVGRLGGDEFLVVCPDVHDAAAAQAVGDRVAASIATPLTVGSVLLTPTASVGVAWSGDRASVDADALIADADAAMYAAKHATTGRAVVADPRGKGLGTPAFVPRERAEDVAVRLRIALERGEFEVHFQPIVDLRAPATDVVGSEALLRWRSGGELIPAGQFLHTLDATGLICGIGPWVVDEVCRHAAANRRVDLRWFVNLSPRELAAPRTVAAFAASLERHGIKPGSVVAEITEHGLLADDGAGARAVTELHALGIEIALDDFGTGWSSLSTLLSVPVQWLKVDRRFTAAAASPRGAAIVAGIIRLAEGLGARTIAEGIEVEAERCAVEAIGVQYGQGYLFGCPQPLVDMPDDRLDTLTGQHLLETAARRGDI